MIELKEIKSQLEEKISSEIKNVTPIEEGVMNFTYDAQSESNNYILKVNPKGREDVAIKEFNAIELCKSKGCKVPKVITCRKADSINAYSYLFYNKLQGISLSAKFDSLTHSDIRKITSEIAESFNCISSLPLSSYGETSDFKQFSHNSWKDFLKSECKESIAYLSDNKIFTKDQIKTLDEYLKKEIKKIDLSSSSFVWTDFDPENIIIDDCNNLSGFVDFEGVLGGDPQYALGSLVAKFGYNNFTELLIEKLNYSKYRLELYAIMRYLRLIKYSKYSLPTGIKRDDINCFLPFAKKLISGKIMEPNPKGDSFGYKLTVSLIIVLLFGISFLSFLCYFNEIYKIDPDGMKITIKKLEEGHGVNSFFLLFGFLAALGSMVRVIYDFVGHTCYTKEFDFKVWWPWYFFRPLLGFILGAIFVIFFDQSLFGDNGSELSKFPFLLSFITGFAVTDAISFLREVSKRLFGIQNNKRKDKNGQEED